MSDIVLITGISTPRMLQKPLGAYKCASTLRANGFSVTVIDHVQAFTQAELIQLLKKVLNEHTLLLGISSTFLTDSNILTTINNSLEEIRREFPQCRFGIGGANSLTTELRADFKVLGYAENSLVDLATALRKNSKLHSKNYSTKTGIVIDDRLAAGLDFSQSTTVWTPQDVINTRVLPIETARGCIFKCKFCAYPMTGKKKLDHIKSAELLYHELLQNYITHGVTQYYIVDDTFNDSTEKLSLIEAAVSRLPFTPLFWAYVRLDLIAGDPLPRMEQLYRIGVRSAFFGIESLDPVAAKTVGKGLNPTKIMSTVQMLRARFPDVHLHGSFIIGLPNETINTMRTTNALLLTQELPLHSWWFNALRIQKPKAFAWSSEFTDNYQQYGYQVSSVDKHGTMHWNTQILSYLTAVDLANEFNCAAQDSSEFHLSAIQNWGLFNLPERTLNDIPKFKDVDWNSIDKQISEFYQQYKVKLNATIS